MSWAVARMRLVTSTAAGKTTRFQPMSTASSIRAFAERMLANLYAAPHRLVTCAAQLRRAGQRARRVARLKDLHRFFRFLQPPSRYRVDNNASRSTEIR